MSALADAGLFARSWLATLGMVAAQGTLLVLVALALTRIGRLRPAWQAALWLVVTLKLALPWGPAMPWSLSDVIATLSARSQVAAPSVPAGELVAGAPTGSALWPHVGWVALALLWAAGAAWGLARAFAVHSRTAHAAAAAPDAPPHARAMLAELAAKSGVRTPRLAVGAPDVGPYVIGVVRPTIVVPPGLLDETPLLRAAILHELAHVRRHDALGRIAQIAAGALMWWLPVMRFVHRRLELAREAACDAWVLENAEISRPAYARLLVRMARLDTAEAPALAAQPALDARVAAVLGAPARARMTLVHRLGVAVFAVVALGGARSATATASPEVCQYTPQLAEALFLAFPHADLDGDGQLSRDEACDLQAELRRVPEVERTSRFSPEDEERVLALLADPLCCNCSGSEVYSGPELASCQKVEGADR